MSLKFSVNLCFMFHDTPSLKEKYKLAKDAGFKAVESSIYPGTTIKDMVEAKRGADVEQILLNVYTGDISKGDVGFAAIPGQEENFKKSIDTTIEYAKALNCKQIHVLSGIVIKPTSANDDVYEKNLLYAVEKFKKEGIVALIEPICNADVPNYYLNSFEKGLNIVKKINSPYLKILIDVFHLQQICGNLTKNIKELMPYTGHVQIGQVPDRNEPDTPGEIDYKYVLSVLEREGYKGYVSLEYYPKSSPTKGLSWLQKYGYKL
nr:putative hydroxypyruvate isomerase [Megalopta genalis]